MLRELTRAVDYIETHLTDDLCLESIAAQAGVSDYHFRTVFFYLSGMSLSEYIKNRRLSEASKALLQGEKVTDVAFQYGYESMDGFTRAFKKWSGFLPSDAAKKGICKSFPKISFKISIQGGVSMEWRTEKKPTFHLAGVTARVPMQFEGINQAIVTLAQSITPAQREELHALQNIAPMEIINASYDADAHFEKEEGFLTHLIGVLTTEENINDTLEAVSVPALTWAVFPNEGPFPSTLQNTMANIYAQWLPASGYELVPAPTFSFTKLDAQKKDWAYSEIWIAVQKQ